MKPALLTPSRRRRVAYATVSQAKHLFSNKGYHPSLLGVIGFLLLCFTTVMAQAKQTAQKPEITFAHAQAAYDAGEFEFAIHGYRMLESNGFTNVEVQYNLANALFKVGDLPDAVRYYRKAWYAAPRDPDIQANLGFALNAANAISPNPDLISSLAESVSKREWLWAGLGAYGALALVLAAALAIRPARRTLLKLASLPLFSVLLATGGWLYWQIAIANSEAVIVRSGATALYGPIEGSTAHYRVPPAALVKITGTDPKGWTEIEYDKKTGWLKDAYIQVIYP